MMRPSERAMNWVRNYHGSIDSTALGLAYDAGAAGLKAALLEVATAGVVFDDERVGYVEVQIDRDTWREVKALAAREEV